MTARYAAVSATVNRSWLGSALGLVSLVLVPAALLVALAPAPVARATSPLPPVVPPGPWADTESWAELPAPAKDGDVEGRLAPRPVRWTPAHVHDALTTASARARCIVTAEIGGVGWNPYAVGARGELGPTQLLPRGGLLPDFYRRGYRDPFSPYESLAYLEAALALGMGNHWTPVRAGRC